MKSSNMSFLLGWFMVGFAIAYILLNSSKWANIQNSESISETSEGEKFGFIENRQNINSTNYVRLPTFRGGNKGLFGTSRKVLNYAENTETVSHITTNYEVTIDKRNEITSPQSNTSVGPLNLDLNYNHFDSRNTDNKDDYKNTYSELTQINSQIASLGTTYAVISTQGSKNQIKTSHGFLTLNTDLAPINSFITESNIQKSTNVDPDPGGNEEMGEPIPVGDGWVFMFMLGLVYGIFKNLKNFAFRV